DVRASHAWENGIEIASASAVARGDRLVAPCGLPVQEPSADAAAREQRDGARRRALVIDPPRGAPPARVVDDAQIAWAQGLVETREPASGPCNVSLERMSDELVRHQSRDSGR